MKKIEKILLAFVFMFVGLFGIQNVDAALAVKYNKENYDYFFTGSNKLDMNLVTTENSVINTAISKFYTAASGAEKVNVVPFKFNIKSGSTWESTDKITMYINIPNELNLDDSTHIYLMKIDATTGAYKVYSVDGQFNGLTYSIKSESDVQNARNSLVIGEKKKDNGLNYLSDKFAVLETSDFSTTGDTYYALITCKGKEVTTTTTTTTVPNQTTTTTTTVPNQTTTTTIENPKTFDANNQLYIIVGVIGLVGIIGLGVKFASSSK